MNDAEIAPAVARDVARRALHDIGPGAARDHLCYAATHGDAAALHAVVEAAHLPSDPEAVLAFLFLTGQWDGYNAADPEPYCANVLRYEFEREPFRVAAERAGRRSPCGPRPPPPRPQKYRPGGTGVAGTGGFSGFSF